MSSRLQFLRNLNREKEREREREKGKERERERERGTGGEGRQKGAARYKHGMTFVNIKRLQFL